MAEDPAGGAARAVKVEEASRPLLLDGARLSRARAPALAARAAAVRRDRGRPPRLALVAFSADDGAASFIPRKVRACREAGVDVIPVLLPSSASTGAARRTLLRVIEAEPLDAVFVEFPFPPQVDQEALLAAVPERLDVDVMTGNRVRRYLEEGVGPPPVTVAATLELLDVFGVAIAGRAGIVVGDPTPFTMMFREALARRGATMAPLVPPAAPDLAETAREADLVIAAASSPGLLSSAALAPGAVAIDVGYFNPGGRGDIDLSAGIGHLGALAPVPGAIGPMTVSLLVERVIAFAGLGL